MAESAALAAHIDTGSLQFPLPIDSGFDGLFQHIYDKLWPKWEEKERIEFVHRTSKAVVLTNHVRDVATFVRRPAYCRVLVRPYSIVSVTTGIAIWGIEAVRLRPNMEPFLLENADRLALFPDKPADKYGQPEKSLERSRVWYRGQHERAQRAIEKASSPATVAEPTQISNNSPRDWESDTALSDRRRNAATTAAKRRFSKALEAEVHDLSMPFEAGVTPSGRPRRQTGPVNYSEVDEEHDKLEVATAMAECALDHCSDTCKELQGKLEAAIEERDRTASERDTLQASIAQMQQASSNSVQATFSEVAKMKMALSAMVASGTSNELQSQGRDNLVSMVDSLVAKMMDQLSGQLTV